MNPPRCLLYIGLFVGCWLAALGAYTVVQLLLHL